MTIQAIDEAIEMVQEIGYTIETEVTLGMNRKLCCPIGAVMLAGDCGWSQAIVDKLGKSLLWAEGFVEGFDFYEEGEYKFGHHSNYYLGRMEGLQYRSKYITD